MTNEPLPVEKLLDEAFDLPPEQRAAFLDHACAGTPRLRQLMEQLIEEEALPASFLRGPVLLEHSRSSPDSPVPLSLQSPPRFKADDLIAGRFQVVRFIARGGMGEVYEVRDQFLQGTPVALKIIRPHIAADPHSSRRFEQEVLLARRVHHRHLCPIYDIFRCEVPAPPFLFLTMKLLGGESLESRLKRQACIPVEEGVTICRQLLEGVDALHSAGIIHRDIKPNNVMLEPCGAGVCATIMDFGLARLCETHATLSLNGAIAGTPGYLAPELIRGANPSPASDLYALGVVMHQIVAGHQPSLSRYGGVEADVSALKASHAPLALVDAILVFLSSDPAKRSSGFEQNISRKELSDEPRKASLVTRRSLVAGAVTTLCCVTGGSIWKGEQIYDLFHPLPKKRFVALLNWPASSDMKMAPMVLDLIDKMTNALSRAEAFDHDFFVASQRLLTEMKTPQQVSEVCESLGANLILATSGSISADGVFLILQVISKDTSQVLRSRSLQVPSDKVFTLPAYATHAAAQLLDVAPLTSNVSLNQADTKNSEAMAAFQDGQALLKQPNYQGVDAAIDKFKLAVDADPRFATAYARLATACIRRYAAHHDAASLLLARANAETALALDPDSVMGHSALAVVYEVTGDLPQALREFGKALALDPSNSGIAVDEAQAYYTSGHWQEAEVCFKRVLKVRPNYWYAYNELGNTYSNQGKYKPALAAYRAASMAGPRNVSPMYGTALMLFLLGDLDGAEAAVAKTLTLSPLAAALQVRANIMLVRNKLAESLRFALQATRMDAEDSTLWLQLADVYARLKRDSDARVVYKHALAVTTTDLETNANDGASWMLLALLQCKLGDRGAANLSLRKAEQKNANDIYSLMCKVRVLESFGRRGEALAMFDTCLKMGATATQTKSTNDLDALVHDPRCRGLMQAIPGYQSYTA